MDHSLLSPFEVNLGWLSDSLYTQRLHRQIQGSKPHWWLYDLRSRFYFMLSQCERAAKAGGIVQLQSYLVDEVSIITFGVSCRPDVIDEVTELLQADPELRRLECFHAARDRESGLVGLEPAPVLALSMYGR